MSSTVSLGCGGQPADSSHPRGPDRGAGAGPARRGGAAARRARRPSEGERAMDGAARMDRAPLRLLADHAMGAGAALYVAGAMVLRGLVPRLRSGDGLDDLARPRPLGGAPPSRHAAHGLRLRTWPDRLAHH